MEMEQFYGEALDGSVVVPSFDGMDDRDVGDQGLGVDDQGLLDDGSISFYASDFPPLLEFPCMSSSSSSSSTGAPVKAVSSTSSPSSSSAASWARLRSDQDTDRSPPVQQQQPAMPFPAIATPLSGLNLTASIVLDCKSEDDRCKEGEAEIAPEDCFDVMDSLGYMELLDCTKLFDPSSMFQIDEPADPTVTDAAYPLEELQGQPGMLQEQPGQNFQPAEGVDVVVPGPVESAIQQYDEMSEQPAEVEMNPEATDEMGQLLMEWLKTNRDSISAEDLRKVKIKKATIESAARRLGGGKAAMKQLLKLILEWVQTNNLHRKRKEAEAQTILQYPSFHLQDHMHEAGSFPSPNPSIIDPGAHSFPMEPLPGFLGQQPQWAPTPYMSDHPGSVMAAPAAYAPSAVGYSMGSDPFSGTGELYPGLADYQMLESPQSWSMPQFAASATNYSTFMAPEMNFHAAAHQGYVGYGNNPQYSNFPGQQYYSGGNGERSIMRAGSSATKEARKKRMARQRRLLSHHHHRSNNGQHGGHHANHHNGHHQAGVMAMDHQQQHASLGVCDQSAGGPNSGNNWMYWPAQAPNVGVPTPPPVMPAEAMQPAERQSAMQGQIGQRSGQLSSDRRPGWKPENNLKFLLQKVLKQSDVGNLGRIVLPKKEAETHLPELEARDGISISMEDIGTSRVWNMRYRFWPNNKSRMYLLENTGDFVRANGLQEGDFIVIYSDMKCGKYLIRGVKVRQVDSGAKSDPKKPENIKGHRSSGTLPGSSTATSNANQRK